MVKTVNQLDKTILNYLSFYDRVFLVSFLENYHYGQIPDGVLWVQYDENDNICGVVGCCNNKSVYFSSQKEFSEELKLVLTQNVVSECDLPYNKIDKIYLMNILLENPERKTGKDWKKFGEISALWGKNVTINTEHKQYLNIKGLCEGVLTTVNSLVVGGGYISNGGDFAFISDVITKSEYRNRGVGSEIVKKLLNCSRAKNVFLLSEEKNRKFYENLGFLPIREYEIYEKVE